MLGAVVVVEIAQQITAVVDADRRVEQVVVGVFAGFTAVIHQPVEGLRHDLHDTHRAYAGLRFGIEAALGSDHAVDQRRFQMVVMRRLVDVLAVLARIAELFQLFDAVAVEHQHKYQGCRGKSDDDHCPYQDIPARLLSLRLFDAAALVSTVVVRHHITSVFIVFIRASSRA